MAQKFIKSQNKNSQSTAFGKYFATAVYDEKFITTEQIADFIQQQCSIKKSDIKAALDTITERRILFQPETERVVVGQTTNKEGKIVQKYVVAKSLIKDVLFEETHENAMKNPSAGSGTVDEGGNSSAGSGSSTGSGTDNGGSGGSGIIPTPTDPEDDQPGD